MTDDRSLEVFQDLTIQGPENNKAKLRDALVANIRSPWSRAEDREREMTGNASGAVDMFAFSRSATQDIPAAHLFLWWTNGKYAVSNIVPVKPGSLGYHGYNAVLGDFVSSVAEPAAKKTGFSINVSSSQAKLEDWLSSDVAQALRRFSRNANKSTGASHPFDRERWTEFLLLAHKDKGSLDTDRLGRWLVEVEGWPDEVASDLVIQYELALDLLNRYDAANN